MSRRLLEDPLRLAKKFMVLQGYRALALAPGSLLRARISWHWIMEATAKVPYLQAKFREDMVPAMKLRGRLKPGAIADITIFDPATIPNKSKWDKGKNSLPSSGIPYVIVDEE